MGVHKTKVRLAVQFESILQLIYNINYFYRVRLAFCVKKKSVFAGDFIVAFV